MRSLSDPTEIQLRGLMTDEHHRGVAPLRDLSSADARDGYCIAYHTAVPVPNWGAESREAPAHPYEVRQCG